MPSTNIRLTKTGTLLITGEFDEITQVAISFTKDNTFAGEFDEVTSIPVAMRANKNNSILQVQEEINEIDPILP